MGAESGAQRFAPPATPSPWARFHLPGVAVLVVGILLSGTLGFASRINFDHTEQRLLDLDTQLTSSALSIVVSSIDSRLGALGAVAVATNGNAAEFAKAARSDVSGTGWVSVALFSLDPAPSLIDSVGAAPFISTLPQQERALLTEASKALTFVVMNLPSSNEGRLVYGLATHDGSRTYVMYAESLVPRNASRLNVKTSSPLSDLNYAIYVRVDHEPSEILAATPGPLPLAKPNATDTTAFGANAVLTLEMSPRTSLVGSLASFLPYGIGGAGLLFTLFVTIMSERLWRRRQRWEALAEENRRLFQAQRGVALTLQRALLPEVHPNTGQLLTAARYLPGADGVDIGGDWFNVRASGDSGAFVAVGDVSGRGLGAATHMASLRYAISAYAAEDPEPDSVLNRLARLSHTSEHGQFATVFCGLLDRDAGKVTMANAGHPVPLLISAGRAELATTEIGPPIGLGLDSYRSVTFPFRQGMTLLLYTDGLIERRGEPISVGMERLRQAASSDLPLETLLDHLLSTLVPDGSSDDLVLLGVRWTA